jgi:hypothetical protein
VGYALLTLVILAVVIGWYEGPVLRQMLLTLVILAGVIGGYKAMTIVIRVRQPWLWLAAAGALGANLLLWLWIVRPEQIRRKRLDNGLCVHCGYDLRGNVSDVCPECGHPA